MNLCDWCGYDISLVHSDGFGGYLTVDIKGNPIYSYRFCSINCCIANINFDNSRNNNIEKRLNYLYNYYNLSISKFIPEARDPKKLIINGGYLNYEAYREGFTCPKIEDKSNRNDMYVADIDERDNYKYSFDYYMKYEHVDDIPPEDEEYEEGGNYHIN